MSDCAFSERVCRARRRAFCLMAPTTIIGVGVIALGYDKPGFLFACLGLGGLWALELSRP